MKIFNTVADLKAATLTAGQLVATKGYYAASDGGESTYMIKTAADFGGTPDEYGDHTLANGNVAVINQHPIMRVAQYGAKGDGVTDDRDAIQACMDATTAKGGGTVMFETLKTYICNSTTRPHLWLKSNTHLDLNNATLQRGLDPSNSTNSPFIETEQYSVNVAVRNGTIRGTGQLDENGQPTDASLVSPADDAIIATYTYATTDQGSAIALIRVTGAIIENITTYCTNGDGIQGRWAEDVVMRNILVTGFGRNGISPTSGSYVYENIIIQNRIFGANPGKGFDAENNSASEKGIHYINNVKCKDFTFVDFYSGVLRDVNGDGIRDANNVLIRTNSLLDGSGNVVLDANGQHVIDPTIEPPDFNHEVYMVNCDIGTQFKPLRFISTHPTTARNIHIGTGVVIQPSRTGAAVEIDNVSNVNLSGCVFKPFYDVTQTPQVLSSAGVSLIGVINGVYMNGVCMQDGFQNAIISFLDTDFIQNIEAAGCTWSDSMYLRRVSNSFFSGRLSGTAALYDSFDNIFDYNVVSYSLLGGTTLEQNTFRMAEDEGTGILRFADAPTGGNVSTGGVTELYWSKANEAVTVHGTLNNQVTTGLTGTNALYIQNLPFDAKWRAVGSVMVENVAFSGNLVVEAIENTNSLKITQSATGAANAALLCNALTSGVSDVQFTITYQVVPRP